AHLLRRAHAPGQGGGGHAGRPLQGSALRADSPLHPPGRGAVAPADHLRIRARFGRRRGLSPARRPLRGQSDAQARSGFDQGRISRRRVRRRKITEDGAPPNGRAMAQDPLDADVILERFYRPAADETAPKKDKPTHYKIVCISLYTEDIAHLEELVAELKRRGHTKANKSQVIRAALDQIDLAKVPKSH